jgi:predicted nucleotidyltransferase
LDVLGWLSSRPFCLRQIIFFRKKETIMNYKIYTIDEIKKRFEKVAKKYEVEEAYLFGSYARGDATKKSDVDFYIKADKIRTLLDLSGFCIDTQKAMKKDVDVITTDAKLEEKFEQEIKKELVKIYG